MKSNKDFVRMDLNVRTPRRRPALEPVSPRYELYVRTVNRLRRMGVKDPAEQITELAEECEYYRARIRGLLGKEREVPHTAAQAAEFAEIVTVPTCGRCHSFVPGVQAIEKTTKLEAPVVCVSHRISPASCPVCGATFTGIVQRIITPTEE